MGSSQIVFLFDLNAIIDESSKSVDVLNKKIHCLRLVCLRFLTDFATKTANLRWGFKIFDSCGSVTQEMHRMSFSDLSLESFETFENEICVRFERHASFLKALAESSQNDIKDANNSNKEKNAIAPVKILQLAVTQLLNEFQWEHTDMWSPCTPKIHKPTECNQDRRNLLVFFGDFCESEKLLLKYFGIDDLPTKSKFANVFVPNALREKLFQKADIRWIWVNVAQNQKFLGTSSKILQFLSSVLNSYHGSLVPLSILSQTMHQIKDLNDQRKILPEKRLPSYSNISNINYSILPFSTILHHSLHYPFYSNKSKGIVFNSSLICNKTEISVQLIKILNRKDECCQEDKRTIEKSRSAKNGTLDNRWSKMIIQSFVSKSIKWSAHELFLCLPDESSTSEDFIKLLKTAYLDEMNLVLSCDVNNDLQTTCLLIPISCDAAVLLVLNPSGIFSDVKNCTLKSKNAQFKEVSQKTCCAETAVKEFKSYLASSSNMLAETSVNLSVDCENGSSLSQFSMESLEKWYQPTSAVSELSSNFKKLQSNLSKVQSFHQLLKLSVRSKNTLNENSKDHAPHAPGLEEAAMFFDSKAKKESDLPKNLTIEELLSSSQNVYNSVFEKSSSILDSAKRIVKMVSHYFKHHKDSAFEENVQNFMKDNLFMTARRISEKYEMMQLDEDRERKIIECQMQVFLALEIEALTLPPEKSICVNNVTAILRMMSFYTGAARLNKLLIEILRENYSNKLYDVLVDIGDELDMPIFKDEESSDSPDILSSELMDKELFGPSSDISIRSASSVSSWKDNSRKLTRYRSDISDSTRSRQVLLPGASPKKKKNRSSAQKKAVRCSPRLASRKNEKSTKTKEKQKKVCRNLFPKEKGSQTPKKNAGSTTPKSKKKSYSTKSKFVAETPCHKQKLSALQRRKSYIEQQLPQNSVKEIAESPKIMKNTNNASNHELLQKFRQNSSESLQPSRESPLQKATSPFKFVQYTPESKRRLSLKLFSKLLSSPTARMGIKKCTKRLFDQVSPIGGSSSYKKFKSLDESKLVATSAKILSDIPNAPNSDC